MNENMNDSEQLQYLHRAFREHLIGGMKRSKFADAYAQTLVYSLWRGQR